MRLGDIWIDAGAFGKGEALDRIAATSGNDRWMVNLGGQIMVYAPAGSDATWSVDIAHPELDPLGHVCRLRIVAFAEDVVMQDRRVVPQGFIDVDDVRRPADGRDRRGG